MYQKQDQFCHEHHCMVSGTLPDILSVNTQFAELPKKGAILLTITLWKILTLNKYLPNECPYCVSCHFLNTLKNQTETIQSHRKGKTSQNTGDAMVPADQTP